MNTRPHNVALPPEIDWLSNAQLEKFLAVSSTVLKRDKSALKTLNLIKIPERSKGCNREAIEILIEFRQLVSERGRQMAIQEIWRKYGARQR